MGRTSQEDELDDLRANLAEDPDLADAFARLEASKDSRRERRSGSEFGNPLKGFVAVDTTPSAPSGPDVSSASAPTERAVSSRSGLPSLHDDDDDTPPDTPTRRYVKSEHADPSLGEPPPSTHRNAAGPGPRDPRRGPPPKPAPLPAPPPAPPPARASGPGRGKPSALVYGPVSSPNGASSAPDPSMPVNSGPIISVRNTSISLPNDEVGVRVTPVVGAPLTPASSAPSSIPTIASGFELPPIADSVESARGPELPENDARAVAPPVAAPALPADEREGSGTRVWLLVAATLLSAAATVVVLMFVVRPFKTESTAAPADTSPAASPTSKPQATAPVATAPPPPPQAAPAAPAPTATEAPATPATEAPAPPATPTAIAATPPTPPTPTAPGAPPATGGFVPQFSKQPQGAPPPTARPPATAKPTSTPTAAPKSTVSPIFEFER